MKLNKPKVETVGIETNSATKILNPECNKQ